VIVTVTSESVPAVTAVTRHVILARTAGSGPPPAPWSPWSSPVRLRWERRDWFIGRGAQVIIYGSSRSFISPRH